jgi:hypothetical protein
LLDLVLGVEKNAKSRTTSSSICPHKSRAPVWSGSGESALAAASEVIGGDLHLNLAGNAHAELEINENQTARMKESKCLYSGMCLRAKCVCSWVCNEGRCSRWTLFEASEMRALLYTFF